MTEVRFRIAAAGASAPVGAPLRPNYDTLIGARASNKEWWHPDTGYVTVLAGNLVSAMKTQKASGGTNLAQASGASQPELIAGAIDGRPALRFQRQVSGAPDRFPYDFVVNPGDAFSAVFLLSSADAQSGAGGGVSLWSGAGVRVDLSYSANDGETFYLRAGPSNVLDVKVPRPVNEFFVGLLSYDPPTQRLAGSVNFGPWVVSSAQADITTTTGGAFGAAIGAGSGVGLNADVAMIGMDTIALHTAANAASLGWWKSLIRDDFPSMRVKIAA